MQQMDAAPLAGTKSNYQREFAAASSLVQNMLVSAAFQLSIYRCRRHAQAPTHIHNLRASARQFIKSENKTWLARLLNNTAETARAAPFP